MSKPNLEQEFIEFALTQDTLQDIQYGEVEQQEVIGIIVDRERLKLESEAYYGEFVQFLLGNYYTVIDPDWYKIYNDFGEDFLSEKSESEVIDFIISIIQTALNRGIKSEKVYVVIDKRWPTDIFNSTIEV